MYIFTILPAILLKRDILTNHFLNFLIDLIRLFYDKFNQSNEQLTWRNANSELTKHTHQPTFLSLFYAFCRFKLRFWLRRDSNSLVRGIHLLVRCENHLARPHHREVHSPIFVRGCPPLVRCINFYPNRSDGNGRRLLSWKLFGWTWGSIRFRYER